THQRYDGIGGVQGALQRQADAALDDACAKTGATRGDVISALLGLVTIDEQGRPTKRRVALDECAPATAAQLDSFVARRLLSTEKAEGERTFVAAAHEAFLVNWPPLKDEIDADVTALRARRIVENAGNDWATGGRDVGSLLQGRQLAKAVVDTGAELQRITEPSAPRRHWRTPGWWPGRRRLLTRVDLDETGREFLEASIRTDRARRLRRITQVAAVIAVLVVITAAAVVGFIQASDARDNARKQFRDATAQRLYADSQLMLAGMQQGGSNDVLAMQEAVAASRIASKHVDAKYPLLVALHRESDLLKIIDTAAPVLSVAVSPDGTRIASGSADHTVRLWDAATGRRIGEPLRDHGDMVTRVAFSPDGTRIASASLDGTVRLWDAASGKPVGPPLHHGGVVSVAFSPDGTRIASAGGDPTIRLWDTTSGQPVGQPLTGHESVVASVAFNRDGSRLVSGSYDKTVRLWDTATGQSIGQPLRHNEWVTSVAFSPDGARIASGGVDKTVRLWDAVTGQPVGEPLRHTSGVFSVAFSPDGARIASAGADRTIRLWDAATLRGIGELAGHRSAVESVAFSHDGLHLVSGGDDMTVRVWDASSWQPMIGHDDTAAARFSDDGKRIGSGGADKTVRWWDAATGRPIGAPLRVDDADVRSVYPVGEDRWVSFGTVNTVRLWDAH
ncbi:MAG TPA: WD40 repeat domain-containing protein, partial [Mycobacterium sp.]|nr:WD40 repeat domain-containing protein [Mycobacterium sp.]